MKRKQFNFHTLEKAEESVRARFPEGVAITGTGVMKSCRVGKDVVARISLSDAGELTNRETWKVRYL